MPATRDTAATACATFHSGPERRAATLSGTRSMEVDENAPNQRAAAWETSKENVAPLKRGRRVDRIEKALSARGTTGRMIELEEREKKFEASVARADAEDPLGRWRAYIRWVEEEFPNDKRKAFLLYERCTRALKDDSRYTNDPKYLVVWLQYADCLSNPADLFKFLHKNGIGRRCHLFWCGWAFFSEHAKNFPQADKILQKGLKHTPEGPEREKVRQRQKEFQRRMSRMWLNQAADEAAARGEEPTEREHRVLGREALEDLATLHGRAAPSSRAPPQNENGGALVGLRGASSNRRAGARGLSSNAGGARPRRPAPQKPRQGFSIFVEEDFLGGGGGGGGGGADASEAPSNGGEWRDFGTEEQRDRENVERAGAWTGRGGLPGRRQRDRVQRHAFSTEPGDADSDDGAAGAAGAAARPSAASIAVFVDEDCEERNRELERRRALEASPSWKNAAARGAAAASALAERARGDKTGAERLSENPLLHLRAPKAPEEPRAPSSRAEPRAPTRTGFDAALLSAGAEEAQFEEARARLPRHARPARRRRGLAPREAPREAPAEVPPEVPPEAPPTRGVPRRIDFGEGPEGAGGAEEEEAAGICSTASIAHRLKKGRASLLPKRQGLEQGQRLAAADGEDMTINTKLALDELADVFCSPGQTFMNKTALEGSRMVDQSTAAAGLSILQGGAAPEQPRAGLSFAIFDDDAGAADENAGPAGAAAAAPRRLFGDGDLEARALKDVSAEKGAAGLSFAIHDDFEECDAELADARPQTFAGDLDFQIYEDGAAEEDGRGAPAGAGEGDATGDFTAFRCEISRIAGASPQPFGR